MFRFVGVGEQAGTGIQKILHGWQTQHWNPPKLHDTPVPYNQTLLELRMVDLFPEEVMAEYRRHFSKPETIHATCEDYRASATMDLDHDRSDRDQPLSIPIQVLWGGQGVVGRTFDPIAIWSPYTDEKVSGTAVPCGHFLAEEEPEETLAHLLLFLEG